MKIDDVYLAFNDGLNYIVGKSNSGKTTIFNSIKYVLGLSKSNINESIYSVDLKICINEHYFNFSRNVGDSSISISVNDMVYQFRPMSKELNRFLSDAFRPDYLFGSEYETIFNLLDFCFLSEERSANRRLQWEAINSICGVNVSLLSSLEKYINSLKKEVYKEKEIQNSVEEFSALLSSKFNGEAQKSDLVKNIELTKSEYFSKFRKDKDLLIDAANKLEDVKSKSEFELRGRIAEIERIFASLKNYAGYENWPHGELESLVKGRSGSMSYGEEIFSKFILVLAIARASQDRDYNFPNIIINDSYLSLGLDGKAYRSALEILKDVTGEEKGLQYIEFTNRDDVPKEYVVLNLNSKGVLHVFRD